MMLWPGDEKGTQSPVWETCGVRSCGGLCTSSSSNTIIGLTHIPFSWKLLLDQGWEECTYWMLTVQGERWFCWSWGSGLSKQGCQDGRCGSLDASGIADPFRWTGRSLSLLPSWLRQSSEVKAMQKQFMGRNKVVGQKHTVWDLLHNEGECGSHSHGVRNATSLPYPIRFVPI